MRVYIQIEEGIYRYLEAVGIEVNLLLELGILDTMDPDLGIFLKLPERSFKAIIVEISEKEFNFLFTKSFEEGKYLGEIIEDSMNSAFFRYILL